MCVCIQHHLLHALCMAAWNLQAENKLAKKCHKSLRFNGFCSVLLQWNVKKAAPIWYRPTHLFSNELRNSPCHRPVNTVVYKHRTSIMRLCSRRVTLEICNMWIHCDWWTQYIANWSTWRRLRYRESVGRIYLWLFGEWLTIEASQINHRTWLAWKWICSMQQSIGPSSNLARVR